MRRFNSTYQWISWDNEKISIYGSIPLQIISSPVILKTTPGYRESSPGMFFSLVWSICFQWAMPQSVLWQKPYCQLWPINGNSGHENECTAGNVPYKAMFGGDPINGKYCWQTQIDGYPSISRWWNLFGSFLGDWFPVVTTGFNNTKPCSSMTWMTWGTPMT